MGKLIVKPGMINEGEGGKVRLLWFIDRVLMLLAFPAVFSLVAEYGFYLSPSQSLFIQSLDFSILWIFALGGLLRLLLISDRVSYLRSHWPDILIMLLILTFLIFPAQITAVMHSFLPGLLPGAIAKIYIVITQILLLLALVPPALRYSQRIMTFNLQPALLIIMSFLIFIVLGTLLLLMPKASVSGSMPLIDALFMSTSAICVTGLVVVDTATELTVFGQAVIMVLMQLGGLGIMTMTTFFAYMLGSGSGLKQYATLQSLLGEESLGRIRSTVIHVIVFAFVVEAVAAVILYYDFSTYGFSSVPEQLFFALFHSVSAFCNGGFSLWSDNLMAAEIQHSVTALVTIMFLIVIGGLGFPVITNIFMLLNYRVRSRFGLVKGEPVEAEQVDTLRLFPQKKSRKLKIRLSLHSKLVLITTSLLLSFGALGIALLEWNGALGALPVADRVFSALFHSVSARTAGFNTLDIGSFSVPSLFFLVLLMWVGASPGSTGGGIKTSTLAVAVLNISAIVSGRNRIDIFRKQVAPVTVVKAFSTVILSVFYIAFALFILLITEQFPFEELLFEVVSAVGTVGLSTGITSGLSQTGKLVIIVSMFIGRIGMLSVLGAVIRQRSFGRYAYTRENVMI
ncbi:ATPase [Prosthecochloris sp. N3]|uniref:ATPase n=1 Tax=Prosthecochloris ethylica TaxID=2743976 RepID=A0ABR9XNB0_9CHLB|nr:potassium transporter TrkG [Prosthecochloris ethylica]MBF0585659.1 ATPase [Prosthecochloris ethylica]MBF0635569.1 ATPase [Prosthecochloris ethylica]NUK46868.1 ATPase [Prosthecochloris ethylica]